MHWLPLAVQPAHDQLFRPHPSLQRAYRPKQNQQCPDAAVLPGRSYSRTRRRHCPQSWGRMARRSWRRTLPAAGALRRPRARHARGRSGWRQGSGGGRCACPERPLPTLRHTGGFAFEYYCMRHACVNGRYEMGGEGSAVGHVPAVCCAWAWCIRQSLKQEESQQHVQLSQHVVWLACGIRLQGLRPQVTTFVLSGIACLHVRIIAYRCMCAGTGSVERMTSEPNA